jgi:hypothetical protein
MPLPRLPTIDLDSFIVEFNENSENLTPNISPQRALGKPEMLLKKDFSPDTTPKRKLSTGSPVSLLKNENSTKKSTISDESMLSSASSNGASYLQKVKHLKIYAPVFRDIYSLQTMMTSFINKRRHI